MPFLAAVKAKIESALAKRKRTEAEPESEPQLLGYSALANAGTLPVQMTAQVISLRGASGIVLDEETEQAPLDSKPALSKRAAARRAKRAAELRQACGCRNILELDS